MRGGLRDGGEVGVADPVEEGQRGHRRRPARTLAPNGSGWISLPLVLLSLLVREGEGREEEGVGEAVGERRREVASSSEGR